MGVLKQANRRVHAGLAARSPGAAADEGAPGRHHRSGAELPFGQLLGRIPVNVNCLAGADFVFDFVHPLTTRALGGADVLGRRFAQVMSAPVVALLLPLLEQVRRTGDECSTCETPLDLDPGGGTLGGVSFWNLTFTPLFAADGEVDAVLWFSLDVTDYVVARRRAAALTEETKATDRRKDEFLAMLAHEMRNPLAPLQTSLHLARSKLAADAAPVARHLEVAQRQAGNLARIVDDLLDVSRITRGRIDLRREHFDFAAAITRAIEANRADFEARCQALTVRLPEACALVWADPVRVDQIVINLLSNASKYTAQGGRVWVSVEHDGRAVCLRVRDDGMGIPAALKVRLFELFQQGSRDLSRSQGGLGIGLTVVRRLVELHGGTVEAHSEGPGRGSEFIVCLPLAAAAHAPAPAAAGPVGRGTGDGEGEGEGARAAAHGPVVGHAAPPDDGAGRAAFQVLVVDDNEDAADALAEVIESFGYPVRVAADGPAALQLAAAWRADLVFLDIGLPGMDGYEVARRMQALPGSRAVLVALTGYGQDSDRRKSQQAGIAHHLVKPPRLDTIEALLARCCRERQLG